MAQRETYVPAMGLYSLARLYDPAVRLFVRERALRTGLIAKARIAPAHRVLDLGCGTATLTIMIKRAFPHAEVFGLDGDPEILGVARRKAAAARLDIRLDEAQAAGMPYAESTFDRVVSSFVFHHLSGDTQRRALQEALRVLKPGGELHVADFAVMHGGPANLASHVVGHFFGGRRRDVIPLLTMMSEVGFERVQDRGRFPTILGNVGFYSGAKPGPPNCA
ncbi:MAG: methyltransferase domain-containing protein [Planctomycetota bacterium]|nr:methyltransferase domain-containing protein [Planctomycetota bacterium]